MKHLYQGVSRAGVGAHTAVTALKHTSWAYEREVRVVYMQGIQQLDEEDIRAIADYLPAGKSIRWIEPLERTSGTKIVKYLHFPFGRFREGAFDPSRAIEKVIVGPHCPLSQSDVTEAMREHDFENFEVTKSICEIR
jgi:hypothetical protein